jgi:aldehyde:ferredoxin oxidoreductase
MLNAATGLSFTEESFQRLGETIFNLERLYNLEAGIGPEQDSLPDICYEPLPDLPKDAKPLRREDMAILMRDYYAARGWDVNGRPTAERLMVLGLKDKRGAS